MRKFIYPLLLLSVITSYASYTPNLQPPMEVAHSQRINPQGRIHRLHIPQHNTTTSTHTRAHARYEFNSGSLQQNITHLAQKFGWPNVVWEPKYDFRWVGKTRFTQNNFKDILRQVLQDFPLQAVFYEGNHILVITPRNI